MNIVFSAASCINVGEVSGVYFAFNHSDAMGKAIVIILLIFSIVTWCLMLIKGISLKHACSVSEKMLREFRSRNSPFALKNMMDEEESPVSAIFKSAFQRILTLKNIQEDVLRTQKIRLDETELQIIRASMEETVAEQILILEDKIIVLMTAVSISPFLGLFGTVWGIMLAFTAMAIEGKPDVSTLAPGVSGALLTTVLGLVVAIPSLIGYNIITHRIRRNTVLMDNFVEEFISKLRIEQALLAKQGNAVRLDTGVNVSVGTSQNW